MNAVRFRTLTTVNAPTQIIVGKRPLTEFTCRHTLRSANQIGTGDNLDGS